MSSKTLQVSIYKKERMNELEKSKVANGKVKKGSKFDSSPSSTPWVSESIWENDVACKIS